MAYHRQSVILGICHFQYTEASIEGFLEDLVVSDLHYENFIKQLDYCLLRRLDTILGLGPILSIGLCTSVSYV